jgi:cytochrome c-type biogenesis protein CcmF
MSKFPDPPLWGIAAGHIGKGLVFAAIAAFALSAILWAFGRKEKNHAGSAAFWVGGGLVFAAFAVHVLLLLTQQYEYKYVFDNTERSMPGVYRFSAAWAAQEGSFLLWTLMSAVFAMIAARSSGPYRRWFSVISSVAIMAMLSILAYESPFALIKLSAGDLALLSPGQTMILPPDGRGLNPTLMNYWMVIHPWVIFTGFGSLLALFSWTASAAISRDWQRWVHPIRPFAIFSMTMLGVGLTMGGLWAYETLGWGGFWAWDPVENVSLVPFVATTVFVHGLVIQSVRKRWNRLNMVLGMLPFVWFVYGTYLTRSGALLKVSVHSFAEMNAGAHGLLLGMVIVSTVALVAAAVRAFTRKADETQPAPLGNRQLGFSVGLFLLYSIGILAAYGMSLPFFAALLGGQKEVVGEAQYNKIMPYPFVPALLAMAIVPFLGWKSTRPERLRKISDLFFIAVLLFGAFTFVLVRSGMTLDGFSRMPSLLLTTYLVLVFVCLFSIVANAARTIERMRAGAGNLGAFITHAGVSILLLGLIVSRAFEKTDTSGHTKTQPARLALMPSMNYIAMIDRLPPPERFTEPDNTLPFVLVNERTGTKTPFNPIFYYTMRDAQPSPVSRPDIHRTALYDLYFVVGAPQTELESSIDLKLGETKQSGDFSLRYIEPTRHGEPGMKGTKFGAIVEVTYKGEKFKLEPTLELGGAQGPIRHSVPIGDIGAKLELSRMDAATKSVSLAVVSPELIFPVQLFFKPLTCLVWLGAGMMTVGGLLSVAKRRKPVRHSSSDETSHSS